MILYPNHKSGPTPSSKNTAKTLVLSERFKRRNPSSKRNLMEVINLKAILDLEIQNLHGDPGQKTKRYEVEKKVFEEMDLTKTAKELEGDLAREAERASTKEKSRIEVTELYSFREQNGNIVYQLGGPYGKLAGLFKDAGKSLYSQKADGFKSSYKSFVKSLVITPVWAELEANGERRVNKIPQLTAGRGHSMIFFYYEVLPECQTQMEIDVPEGNKRKFLKLLNQAEGMPFGPKRRGTISVQNVDWDN